MKEFEIAQKIGKELTAAQLNEAAAKALGVKADKVGHVEVVRRSIDARQDILYRYRVQACRQNEPYEPYQVAPYKDVHSAPAVIVVGAGPAGMFAALKLLQKGLRPIVLERGKDVERRKVDMARLSTEGALNPDSNYCYGEGGAGAFSDGKLYTRSSKRGDIREVLHQLVAFGAHPDILIDAHPHIGTDRLPEIVKNIRQCIGSHGGEYHFDAKVTDIDARSEPGMTNSEPGMTKFAVSCADGSVYQADKVILATGHSARDIYELFQRKGWTPRASPWPSAWSIPSGRSTRSAITASTSPSCPRPNIPSCSSRKAAASFPSACAPEASWSPLPPKKRP